MKTHLMVLGVDCRNMGQTEYEYTHQAACGYVRENVTRNKHSVDCKICINSEAYKNALKFNGEPK